MSKMTKEQLIGQLPKVYEELSEDLASEPRFVTSVGKAVGHVESNGNLVEVQLKLERDEREWQDEDFACEVSDQEEQECEN